MSMTCISLTGKGRSNPMLMACPDDDTLKSSIMKIPMEENLNRRYLVEQLGFSLGGVLESYRRVRPMIGTGSSAQ